MLAPARLLRVGDERGDGQVALPMELREKLGLKLRDPRVEIVRHHIHPGRPALLRDGARIARPSNVPL
jgi:bifunctional DNA-binding transcriptional regulator/antitoxin component of YhaV-PrlF toxin-antitoxin module